MSLYTEEAERRAAEQGRALRVDYAGWQEGFAGAPGFHLWTLREAIPGHPAGSTVSGETILNAGYRLRSQPGKPRG